MLPRRRVPSASARILAGHRLGEWCFRWCLALAVVVVTCTSVRSAQAYTWMIKHGYGSCGTCHADPSGGELLTDYGRMQGELLVRMVYGKEELSAAASAPAPSSASDDFASDDFDFDAPVAAPSNDASAPTAPASAPPEAEAAAPTSAPAPAATANASTPPEAEAEEVPSSAFLWGAYQPPDWLLLGGAYRQLSIFKTKGKPTFIIPMQADLYGQLKFGALRFAGSLGAARVAVGSPHARAAQVTTNQGKQWNLLSRSHWIGYEASGDVLIRAGRLNLPFGVRIPEHTAWVRDRTRTDRESDQQHGLALSFGGQAVRAEVMAVLGNYQLGPDKFRERGYAGFAEYFVGDTTALGVSSLITHAEADRLTLVTGSTLRQAHGLLARVSATSDLVVLAEADALLHSFSGAGYVGLVQADYELVQGLHLIATGEILDAGLPDGAVKVAGAGKPMLGADLAIDWFFYRQLELRFDIQARQNEAVTFLPQLHVYL